MIPSLPHVYRTTPAAQNFYVILELPDFLTFLIVTKVPMKKRRFFHILFHHCKTIREDGSKSFTYNSIYCHYYCGMLLGAATRCERTSFTRRGEVCGLCFSHLLCGCEGPIRVSWGGVKKA